jgi:hypothetical protein
MQSAAANEVDTALYNILTGCGVPTSSPILAQARADAAVAYNSPTGSLFAVPTQALSRVMRALKQKAGSVEGAPATAPATVEQAFMRLVTKVSTITFCFGFHPLLYILYIKYETTNIITIFHFIHPLSRTMDAWCNSCQLLQIH